MARESRSWYVYTLDDHGDPPLSGDIGIRIKDSEALELARGWVAAVGVQSTPPQMFKPRHVVGRDANGHVGRAIIATVAADLWTGVASTFTVSGVEYTVTGYVGERRSIAQN